MTIKRFCLMTEGRSGSTSLMEALQVEKDIAVPSKNIKCPDNELVHLQYFNKYCREYSRLCKQDIHDAGELIDVFFKYNDTDEYNYAGFKSMPNRHPDYDVFTARPDIQFITLQRRDFVSTVASFILALVRGSWRRHGESWDEKWTFDQQQHGDSIRSNLGYIYESHRRLDSITGAIRLYYEDLCNPDYQCAELNEFFMRPVGLIDPKPATDSSTYVSNWEEFRDFVNGFWEGLAQEQSDQPDTSLHDPIPLPQQGDGPMQATPEIALPELSGVEAYCQFLGYPISGSTLVMGVLNAHPDVAIGHGAAILNRPAVASVMEDLASEVLGSIETIAASDFTENNVSYAIPGQWQGRYRELKILGDDTAGLASIKTRQQPEWIKELESELTIPLRFVHVYRNPFDHIASLVQASKDPLEKSIGLYFSLVQAVESVRNQMPDGSLLDICLEDFVRFPEQALRKLCEFLDISCDDGYIEACSAAITRPLPRQRDAVTWTPTSIAAIRREMQRYRHLQRYVRNEELPAAPTSPPVAGRTQLAEGERGVPDIINSAKPRRIIYAWELGMDLGHIMPFLPLAMKLRDRGHEVIFAIRDLQYAETAIGHLGFQVMQAPVWLAIPKGLQNPPLNYTEIILRYGFLTAPGLKGLVKAWRTLLQYTGADLMVADHAPSALLAAHTMGLKRVTIGTGFCAPPSISPMPNMRPWLKVPQKRLRSSDAIALQNANAVIADLGGRPMKMMAELFQVHTQFLCTFAELDHYRERGGKPQYWGPTYNIDDGVPRAFPAGEGKAVFVYLKTIYKDYEKVLQALKGLDARVLAYVPGLPDKLVQKYSSDRMVISREAVQLRPLMEECHFAVCHAGAGTVAAFLLNKVPLLLLPTQLEQYLLARRVEEMGAGLVVNIEKKDEKPDYKAKLGRLLAEEGFAGAAAQFAEKYQKFDPAAQSRAMTTIVEKVLKE